MPASGAPTLPPGWYSAAVEETIMRASCFGLMLGLAALLGPGCGKKRPTLRHPKCDNLMTPQVLEEHTPGWRLAARQADDVPGTCSLQSEDGSLRAIVLLACSPELTQARFEAGDQSMLSVLNGDTVVPVSGLGRAARRGEHDIMVLDDNTDCVVALTSIGEIDPVEGLAEELVLRLNRRTAR